MRIEQTLEWLLERGNVSPWPDPIPHSLQDVVRDAVEALADEDQWLILMKFYELLTYDEIAYRTGRRSKGSAYYHVHKALGKLKEEIVRRMSDDDNEGSRGVGEDIRAFA